MDETKIGSWQVDLKNYDKINTHRSFELSTTVTNQASVDADALSTNELLPVKWFNKIVDAAKARQVFQQLFEQYTLGDGMDQCVIPRRTNYMATGDWEASSTEYAVNENVLWTDITTADGIQIDPGDEHYGVEITNKAVRTNALPQIQYCRDELAYRMSDVVETAVTTALDDAAAMSNTVAAMQTIFGGDATDVKNNLDAGDVLSTTMINKAERLIESNYGYYWNSNVWTQSAKLKNPWELHDSPIYLYVAPEQKQALRNSGQFMNAAEYGTNEVVMKGEIGQYIGVKVLSTTKTPGIAANGTFTYNATTGQEDIAYHTCFMAKSGVSGALVWSVKPKITVFDWPSGMKKRLLLEMAYGADTVQDDAIVKLVVADE